MTKNESLSIGFTFIAVVFSLVVGIILFFVIMSFNNKLSVVEEKCKHLESQNLFMNELIKERLGSLDRLIEEKINKISSDVKHSDKSNDKDVKHLREVIDLKSNVNKTSLYTNSFGERK